MSDERDEPFGFKEAQAEINKGYAVRHEQWPPENFVYMEDFVLYNQDDEEVGFDLLRKEKEPLFEYFREEDPCEMMDESGTKEDGELRSKLSERNELIESESEIEAMRIENEITSESDNTTLITKKISTENQESDTMKTQMQHSNVEQNGVETIGKDKMKPSEIITTKTGINNSPKSLQTGVDETQQLALSQIWTQLKEENSGSIHLLDDSARQLHKYAAQLASPPKVDEETGEVIQRASNHQIMDAVKCLDACRNTMQTKLEYLKFGKSLLDK